MSLKLDDGLTVAQQHAALKGGSCLSQRYVRALDRLQWQCNAGHVWEATFANVVSSGSWCKACAGKEKHTLFEAQALAKTRGGRCLSDSYQSLKIPLVWQCSVGHTWEARLSDILHRGSWCFECSYLQRGLDGASTKLLKSQTRAEKVALQHGFLFVGRKTRTARQSCGFTWQCSKEHQWDTRAMKDAAAGCPYCQMSSQSLEFLLRARQMAEVYGGECVSQAYHTTAKMQWKCSEGHTWSTKYQNIQSGTWCPRCKTIGRREEFCRQVLEYLFGASFDRIRPKWLLSPKGHPLELDGYSETLKIAFEHQGIQHYEDGHFKTRRRKGKVSFASRLSYDAIKVEQCQRRGITLLVIPYTVLVPELESWIRSALTQAGITVPTPAEPLRLKTLKRVRKSRKKPR
jgi:hypothetical protein